MKYAILSTDNNPDYYSLLPLVCHSWRKIGYTPVIIFVNVPENIRNTILDYCPGALKTTLDAHEGVKDSTIAQVQRLFEWMKCQADDIIITGDADMVIARDIFTHDVSHGQIVSYGYDLTGRSELPICYVKATAAKWRELMGEFTIPEKAYSDKWEDYWSVDQQLLTQRAHEHGMGRITFIDRGNQNKHGLPTGRWDRYDFSNIPDSIIDVHMPRNDWNAQIDVFQKLWPGEDHSFITKFREALEGKGRDDKYDLSFEMEPQNYLNFISNMDTHKFLEGAGNNWHNHRPLLLLALSLTSGPVMEMGSGDGSTPYLRKFCNANGRTFQTFDNNEDWCKKTGADYVQTELWGALVAGAAGAHRGLIFIDHAPGERRHEDAIRLANAADILVLHDTEEGGAGNYMWDKAWPHFRYRLNYNKTGGGAGATAVSNKIDLNQFRGLTLGKYTFDND